MSSKVLAVSLAIVGLVALCIASVVPAQPQPVGADGVSVNGLTIGLPEILKLLGGGSIGASILAFWGRIQPFAETVIHTVNPAFPVPPKDIGKIGGDSIELAQAVLAYAAKRDDKTLQRRLVVAVCTEIGDMTEMENPEVAKALNALLLAATNVWLPVPSEVKA